MSILKKLYQILLRILEVIAMITIGLMVIVVFYSVISRFVLNSSIAWAEEVSRFLMMWMTFVGAVVAFEEDKHMRFDSLVNVFPEKLRAVVLIAGYALIFVLLVNLTRGGLTYALNSWNWTSPATHTHYGYVYMVAPVCLGIMALQSVLKIILVARESFGGHQKGEEAE